LSMLKKFGKSLFYIPPEIKCYFNYKLSTFFFFGLNGWCVDLLIKKVSFMYSTLYKIIRLFNSSSYLINNLIFGLIKCYFKYFQIKGRSFRYLFRYSILILKFGYSHKLYYMLPNNTYFSLINKQVLKISGKSLQNLKSIFFDLHSIRKFDKYKGKGLLYYKDTLILKASSKKTKV